MMSSFTEKSVFLSSMMSSDMSDNVQEMCCLGECNKEHSAMHSRFPQYMELKVFVDGSNDLYKQYENAMNSHNERIMNEKYVDAGFDLYAPQELICASGKVNKLDFKVKCSASIISNFGSGCKESPTGYYMYARSSIYKTRLRMANSVGIIDSGYRGNIMAMLDCLPGSEDYKVERYDRLTQICAPGLMPIVVKLVDNTDELGSSTRGEGGFGSSGR